MAFRLMFLRIEKYDPRSGDGEEEIERDIMADVERVVEIRADRIWDVRLWFVGVRWSLVVGRRSGCSVFLMKEGYMAER